MERATADRGPGGAMTLPPAESHPVRTSDGTEIRLTHYAMGSKGPIVSRRARPRSRHGPQELRSTRRARL
jgi:hypothetical protein